MTAQNWAVFLWEVLMSRIIFKAKYLRSESKTDRGGFIGYIATRTGAVLNMDKMVHVKPTDKQKELINQLSDEFPSIKLQKEYKKYVEQPSVASASELIDAACEENYSQISKKEDFVSYIAERPGVVKTGTHGLFSIEDGPIPLERIKNEVKEHSGIIWTHVLSLRREDAIEFGYETQEAWKNLLRKNHFKMAKSMNIEPQHFHWYAAFHDTAHHPHVHIVMYSDDPKQGHLTIKGIDKMRSAFVSDIFKDELTGIYQHKEEIKEQIKAEIVEMINKFPKVKEPERMNELMLQLHESLKEYKGKITYGYLSKGLKAQVDDVMREIEKIPEVNQLLEKWKELIGLQYSYYSDTVQPEVSFIHDKTFRPLKNKVIAFALNYDEGHFEVDSFDDLKVQLTGRKPDKRDDEGPVSLKVTLSLLHHLGNLVRKSAGIKNDQLQSDKAMRFKTKLQKMALGQNENDTQQFG